MANDPHPSQPDLALPLALPIAGGLNWRGLRSAAARLQWQRGLRAAIAVGCPMLACYLLHKPSGWVALGGLQVAMIDNGGPLRARLGNVLTVLLGATLAVYLGGIAGASLPATLCATFLFCFAFTLARVLTQPLAISSVVILVTYVIAVGGAIHTQAQAATNTANFVAGALWSSLLCLTVWPSDPFSPARIAIAETFSSLLTLITLLPESPHRERISRFNEALARFRQNLEIAQTTLSATPARMTARTIRARNLTVVIETADLLLARLLRFAELSELAHDPAHDTGSHPALDAIAGWLTTSIQPIEAALRTEPPDRASAFSPSGSYWINLHRTLPSLEAKLIALGISPLLHDALLDSQFIIEAGYEALRAVWSGYEPRREPLPATELDAARGLTLTSKRSLGNLLDALRANLTLHSVMFRHALRLAAVVTLDELITHFVRVSGQPVSHGYWLAMTSLIVLQPYTGETVRRSGERVAGTVLGGILAAALAAAIHTQLNLLLIITAGTFCTLAFYAVDYSWYCFFLTPTVVLMTLPHLRDWHFAAVRMGMTCLGAAIAIFAMIALWPERESRQLPRLLARAAAAESAYLRAAGRFWSQAAASTDLRLAAERTLLAPARRLCGLATNEAEETLDRALLEYSLPLNPQRQRTAQLNRSALTFTTYIRRLTQTITTLAATSQASPAANELITMMSDRLDTIATCLAANTVCSPSAPADGPAPAIDSLPPDQLRRLVRQISVLERTAAELSIITQP